MKPKKKFKPAMGLTFYNQLQTSIHRLQREQTLTLQGYVQNKQSVVLEKGNMRPCLVHILSVCYKAEDVIIQRVDNGKTYRVGVYWLRDMDKLDKEGG